MTIPDNINEHHEIAYKKGATLTPWDKISKHSASKVTYKQYLALGILMSERQRKTAHQFRLRHLPQLPVVDAENAMEGTKMWRDVLKALREAPIPLQTGLASLSHFRLCDGADFGEKIGLTGGHWQVLFGQLGAIHESRLQQESTPKQMQQEQGGPDDEFLPESSLEPEEHRWPQLLQEMTRTAKPTDFHAMYHRTESETPSEASESPSSDDQELEDVSTKSEKSVVCATNTLMLMLNQTRLDGETYQNLQWLPYDVPIKVDYTAILDGALVRGSFHGDVLAGSELKRRARSDLGDQLLMQEALEIVTCLQSRPAEFSTTPFLLYSLDGVELYVSITTPTAAYLEFLKEPQHRLRDLKEDDYLSIFRIGPYQLWNHRHLKEFVAILLAYRKFLSQMNAGESWPTSQNCCAVAHL